MRSGENYGAEMLEPTKKVEKGRKNVAKGRKRSKKMLQMVLNVENCL